MNLVTDSWIPVQRKGEKDVVSLQEIFSGNSISDLNAGPHQRIALMRLFTCISHAAEGNPVAYLHKWKHAFNLYGDKPFLQMKNLEPKTRWSPTRWLDITAARDAGAVLFRWQDGVIHTPDNIVTALNLLTYQNLSVGGLVSFAKLNGKEISNKSADAPCAPSSMLHTFLIGNNLAETITLNIVPEQDILQRYGSLGRPIWEDMPSVADDTTVTDGYLKRLVPLAKMIRLQNQDHCCITKGFNYSHPAYESTSTLAVNKKGIRHPVGARHGMRVWRQLGSLISARSADDIGGSLTLRNAPLEGGYDIRVCAVIRKPGQSVYEDLVDSVLTVPPNLNDRIGLKVYIAEVEKASLMASSMAWAVKSFWKEMLSAKTYNLQSADSFYWSAVEENLPLLFDYMNQIGNADKLRKTRKQWRNTLYKSAVTGYRQACIVGSGRAKRAVTENLRKIGLKKSNY